MKTSALTPFIVAALVAPVAGAQEFSIPWYSLDGSGGASSGGAFALAGSTAPFASEPLSGGGFTVAGGIWSLAAVVALPDTPLLRIQPAPGGIVVAWPQASDGFQLQESPSLLAPAWSAVPTVPGVVGSEKQVVLPAQPGHRFFRLHKP